MEVMQKSIAAKTQYQHRWWILVGLIMGLVVLNLDLTIVNLALPILGHKFHTKLSALQWIINVYSLTFAALVILSGKLADRYGYRLIYLCGISSFFIGSLVAGLAPRISVIILGRLLQGIGMAGTYGMIFILANAVFPARERKFAIGILITFVGVAQAAGPTVGGLIIEHWGWRWAFLINAPICAISFLIISLTCHDNPIPKKPSIHYPSAFLLMITYVGLILVFNTIQDFETQFAKLIVLIIVCTLSSVALIGVFVWQCRLKEPLIDLELFRNKIYCTLSIVRPIFQFTVGALFFLLPLYLQNIVGMSPTTNGLVMLMMTSALAVSSIVIGRLGRYIPPAWATLFAYILTVLAFSIFAILPSIPIHWLPFSIALVAIGISIGLILTVTNTTTIDALPSQYRGIGYAFLVANAFFFYSLGIAITGHLMSSISFTYFQHAIASHISPHSHLINDLALKSYTNGAQPIQAIAQKYPENYKIIQSIAIHSFSKSYRLIMWLMTSLSLLGMLFSFRLFNLKSTHEAKRHANDHS
jgi:EmrB/QacA subfamily drug resistance transporter